MGEFFENNNFENIFKSISYQLLYCTDKFKGIIILKIDGVKSELNTTNQALMNIVGNYTNYLASVDMQDITIT